MESYSFKKNRGVGVPLKLYLNFRVPAGYGNVSMICSREKRTCSQSPAPILTTRASGIAAGAATVGHMLRQSVQHHTS